jgi:hypothetical protein
MPITENLIFVSIGFIGVFKTGWHTTFEAADKDSAGNSIIPAAVAVSLIKSRRLSSCMVKHLAHY